MRDYANTPKWKHINEHFAGNFTSADARLITWQANIFSYLSEKEATNLEQAYPYLHRKYGDTVLKPPENTLHRQRHGFGQDTKKISCTHSTPSPYLMIHYAWDFLGPSDRRTLGERTSVYFDVYAVMRQKAMTEDISLVKIQRAVATEAELIRPIDKRRAYHLAIALMRFN